MASEPPTKKRSETNDLFNQGAGEEDADLFSFGATTKSTKVSGPCGLLYVNIMHSGYVNSAECGVGTCLHG